MLVFAHREYRQLEDGDGAEQPDREERERPGRVEGSGRIEGGERLSREEGSGWIEVNGAVG